MALIKEYFDITKQYNDDYGENTILLMMVGSFFVYVAMIISAVVWGISHNKGIAFYAVGSLFAFMFFLMYFQIRLLYSMCVR